MMVEVYTNNDSFCNNVVCLLEFLLPKDTFSMITRVTTVSALACPTVWIDAKKDARLKNVFLYDRKLKPISGFNL